MPLTLAKLFSTTVESKLEVLGEIVHLTWSPSRYTGEMDELAKQLSDQEDVDSAAVAELEAAGDTAGSEAIRKKRDRATAAACRTFIAQMLVAWDVLDGKVPHSHDLAGLMKLPDWFVIAVFMALSEENETDPTNAPSSDVPSSPKASSARSPRGSRSSGARKSSGSPRGT